MAADVMMVADIACTVLEFRKLAIDAVAALDFVNDGPHAVEDLQVSSSMRPPQPVLLTVDLGVLKGLGLDI